MIKIKQAIIVEGKYDKIKLNSIVDAPIITTNGFAVFNDKEKQKLIRRIAKERGIVVLTDSDSAGFVIRSFFNGSLPKEQVINAYIPDIFGKEKRKETYSKEGKLGVEGVPTQVIINALERAGVIVDSITEPERRITKLDLFNDGLSGGENSKAIKSEFLKRADLPEHLSSNALVEMLNVFMSYEQYKSIVNEIN